MSTTAEPQLRDKVPSELQKRRQWLAWNLEGGTKIPKKSNGFNGKSNDPATWMEFDEAVEVSKRFTGTAFVISGDDPYTGIDLDNCLDAAGELRPWAVPIVEKLSPVSFGEISPSGRGIKFLTRAKKPPGAKCTKKFNGEKQQLECYDHARFWTITGDTYGGCEVIDDGQDVINWICVEHLSQVPKNTQCTKSPKARHGESTQFGATDKMVAARNAMRKVEIPNDESDGSRRLIKYARQAVRYGLHESECLSMIRQQLAAHPTPKSWSDEQLKDRYYDALRMGLFGEALGMRVGDELRPLSPEPISQLLDQFPSRQQPLIDGVLRRAETMNIIGSTKSGKTWFLYKLLFAIATGQSWLGHKTTPGRVLLIDNELRKAELSWRLRIVARELCVPRKVLESTFSCIALRGRLRDIDGLHSTIESLKNEGYDVIAFDALYRMLPKGISENANAEMTAVYNTLDRYAESLDCAIILNHHSSKGDQSGKAVTDVGSGAGAMARAVDTHLTFRPHEEADCAVLEGAMRSFPPLPAKTIKWSWPTWELLPDVEASIRRPMTNSQHSQNKRDAQGQLEIIEVLKDRGPRTRRQLQTDAGMGPDRINRLIAQLIKKEVIHEDETQPMPCFFIPPQN